MATKINPKQLKSVTGSFDSLHQEIETIATIQAENMMDVDIAYVRDSSGNVIQEVVTDTSAVPVVLSEVEYVYSSDGNIEQEIIIRNSNRIVKTYKYSSTGEITGVSIRVNP